jgi:hypothetical protein
MGSINYSLNDIIRNNTHLKGGLYWSLNIEKVYDPSSGSWDSGTIYVKGKAMASPWSKDKDKVVTNSKSSDASEAILYGYSNDPHTIFNIEVSATGYKPPKGGGTGRLIKFRIDTWQQQVKGATALTDGGIYKGTGKALFENKITVPTGASSSMWFYYDHGGGDRMWAEIDDYWPCTNASQRTCAKDFSSKKIPNNYWAYSPGGTIKGSLKHLTTLTPCGPLKILLGNGAPNTDECYPKWIEFNYLCDTDCGPCDQPGKEKAKFGESYCCPVSIGLRPTVGSLIRIDKNPKNTSKAGLIQGSDVPAFECYKIKSVVTDMPTGVTQQNPCKCSVGFPTGNWNGSSFKNGLPFCVSDREKIVSAMAPGEGDTDCFKAGKRYKLTEEIARTLSSFGWGENIGGFQITGFEGTIVDMDCADPDSDPNCYSSVNINRMLGHGHFTKTAYSIPGNSQTNVWMGGNSWLSDKELYVDQASFKSLFTTTVSDSMTFIDRWRQTIEMNARAGDPTLGEDETVYELVDAWPPRYLEMFVRRTYTSTAALSLGMNTGRNFECGINLVINSTESTDVGSTYPIDTESTTIGCSAYMKFSNLLNFTKQRWGHTGGARTGNGNSKGTDFSIVKDYLTIDIDLGGRTETMSHDKAAKLFEETDPESKQNTRIAKTFHSTLFKTFTANVSYGAQFSNGWNLSVSGIKLDPASGFAKGIDPVISLSKTFMDDKVQFTIAQTLSGGGTLGLSYQSPVKIYGHETEDSTKMFASVGIACEHATGSASRFSPSLQFHGQVGSIKSEKFSHILNGFEWDANLIANTKTIKKNYNFSSWSHDTGDVSAGATFALEAQALNINAPLFKLGGDAFFEWTVHDFGKMWGQLCFRATATYGLSLGNPGSGGLIGQGGEIGFAIGFYMTLKKNTFLEWLGFPFNVNPGIGMGLGMKFNFRSKSSLTQHKSGAGKGAVAGAQSQAVFDMGPVRWNVSAADSLRQHMQVQHDSLLSYIPLGIGDLLKDLPILTVLGPSEAMIRYIIRACLVRTWAGIGLAAQAYMNEMEKAYKDGLAKYVTVDNSLNCSSPAKYKHRTFYNPRFRNKYNVIGTTPGPHIDRKGKAHGGSHDACGAPHPDFKSNPKNCWANGGDPKNGDVTGSWLPQCHYAAQHRDDWVKLNPPCPTIKTYFEKIVSDKKWQPYDVARWPELAGQDGILILQFEVVEQAAWQWLFYRNMNLDWDNYDDVRPFVEHCINTIGFGGYEKGVIGVNEHGKPQTLGPAAQAEYDAAVSDLADFIVKTPKGGWFTEALAHTPLVGRPLSWGVDKVDKGVKAAVNGFDFVRGKLGWKSTSTSLRPEWMDTLHTCDLTWDSPEEEGDACERAWVKWNYYTQTYFDHISRWWSLANGCALLKGTCTYLGTKAYENPVSMDQTPYAGHSDSYSTLGNIPGGYSHLPVPGWEYQSKDTYKNLGKAALGCKKCGNYMFMPPGRDWTTYCFADPGRAAGYFGGLANVTKPYNNWCNQKWFWVLYNELLAHGPIGSAIDDARKMLDDIAACDKAGGNCTTSWPIADGETDGCIPLRSIPIECYTECLALGEVGQGGNGTTADKIKKCSFDDYWVKYREHRPWFNIEENAQGVDDIVWPCAHRFFGCLCYSSKMQPAHMTQTCPGPQTPLRTGLNQPHYQGVYSDHVLKADTILKPLMGADRRIRTLLSDWAAIHNPHYGSSNDSGKLWLEEYFHQTNAEVIYKIPWDGHEYKFNWSKHFDDSRGGYSNMKTMVQDMQSLYSEVAPALQMFSSGYAGPNVYGTSPFTSWLDNSGKDRGAKEYCTNCESVAGILTRVATKLKLTSVRGAPEPAQATLNLMLKDVSILNKLLRCAFKHYLFSQPEIKIDVTDLKAEMDKDAIFKDPKKQAKFWSSNGKTSGSVFAEEGRTIWKVTGRGTWVVNDASSAVGLKDGTQVGGAGAGVEWSGSFSALSLMIRTFCLAAGSWYSKGIQHELVSAVTKWLVTRMGFIDINWLFMGNPEYPRDLRALPGGGGTATVWNACVGGARTLISSSKSCTWENCRFVEPLSASELSRLTDLGSCSMLVCSSANDRDQVSGGYAGSVVAGGPPMGIAATSGSGAVSAMSESMQQNVGRGNTSMASAMGSSASKQSNGEPSSHNLSASGTTVSSGGTNSNKIETQLINCCDTILKSPHDGNPMTRAQCIKYGGEVCDSTTA